MSTAQIPTIPGVTVMTDTLDFVKNLWGSMSVPGMNIPGITAPTFSVEELDKKINDMKAVETWLNLNMSMLRGTIQALEVQRGTIATLKSMGASIAAAVHQTDASSKGLFDSIPYASAFFQQPSTMQPTPDQSKAQEAEAAPAAPVPAAKTETQAENDVADAPSTVNHPAAWWNVLQNQFTQAVATALTPDPSAMQAEVASANHADTAPLTAAAKAAPKRAAAKPKAAKPVK